MPLSNEQWLILLCAYLIGSFPTGFLTGKIFFKINLFEHGSKNVGATNALRVLGKKAGIFVLLVDMLKGAIPVMLAAKLSIEVPWFPAAAGMCAILGHTFSPFLKFKGGKGVATSAGVFAALAPLALLCALALFSGTVFVTRFVSLGSMLASVSLPAFCYLWYPKQWFLIPVSGILSLFVIYKHRANIGRLLKGEENKLSFSKSKREQ